MVLFSFISPLLEASGHKKQQGPSYRLLSSCLVPVDNSPKNDKSKQRAEQSACKTKREQKQYKKNRIKEVIDPSRGHGKKINQ